MYITFVNMYIKKNSIYTQLFFHNTIQLSNSFDPISFDLSSNLLQLL